MSEKLMLIDGHSILNRAFFGVPDLTNSEGIHTNAMYGFLNIMFKFLDEEKPDYLVVAFDLSKPTFRHEKYSEYKAGRHAMAPELKEQVPLMKEILESMNIKIVSKEGFEGIVNKYPRNTYYEIFESFDYRYIKSLPTSRSLGVVACFNSSTSLSQ
jgi:DNA polymerase-1